MIPTRKGGQFITILMSLLVNVLKVVIAVVSVGAMMPKTIMLVAMVMMMITTRCN